MTDWKLVPVEPTGEMIGVAQGAYDAAGVAGAADIYAAMLAAAPKASEDEELVARASLEIARIAMGYDTAHDYRAQARAVLKMLEADHG